MAIVVHVDDIVAVGGKARCDQFGRDLGQIVPVTNLGELRWHSGCFYERDREKGVLKISRQTFAEQLSDEYGMEFGRSIPLCTCWHETCGIRQEWAAGDWPFRELVGSLMWLSTQTRPDISNAVRAVTRYCAALKLVHWKAALGILGCVIRTIFFGITFQRGTTGGMNLHVFADGDYASQGANRRSVSWGLETCGGACVSMASSHTLHHKGRVRGAC